MTESDNSGSSQLRSLLHLIQSDDLGDRVAAGKVIRNLMEPAQAIVRRVESVHLQNRNINERSVSLDLDLASSQSFASDSGIKIDAMPLSILPKGIIYDFDMRDATGRSISAVGREVDSRISQCLLVAIALELCPSLDLPSQNVWTLIYELTYRFPKALPRKKTARRRAELSGRRLQGDDAKWWGIATASPEWSKWLTHLEEHFLLVARIESDSTSQIIKYRRTEAKETADDKRLRALLNSSASPGKYLRVPLYDLGRARSEHVRLNAPIGTFLADGTLNRKTELEFTYRLRASRAVLAFYVSRAEPGDADLLATLWPEPRGFIMPLRLLAWYSTFAVLLGMIMQFQFNVAHRVTSLLDAFLAFALFFPALIIAFLFRPDEPDIRWDILRPWRRLAFYSVVPLWVAIAALFIGPSIKNPIPLGCVFAAAFLGSCYCTSLIERSVRRVYGAVSRVRVQEKSPSKGARVFRQRDSDMAHA